MGLHLIDLSASSTRTRMAAEVEHDIATGNLYYSRWFTSAGHDAYPPLLMEAATQFDDDWLAAELSTPGMFELDHVKQPPAAARRSPRFLGQPRRRLPRVSSIASICGGYACARSTKARASRRTGQRRSNRNVPSRRCSWVPGSTRRVFSPTFEPTRASRLPWGSRSGQTQVSAANSFRRRVPAAAQEVAPRRRRIRDTEQRWRQEVDAVGL